jgi:hypothetical protein
MAAVMALEGIGSLMESHCDIAVLAEHGRSTMYTGGIIRKASPVQEKEGLFPAVQGLIDCLLEFFCDERLGTPTPFWFLQVDNRDLRK